MIRRSLFAVLATLLIATPTAAQAPAPSTRTDSLAVLALADSALVLISASNFGAFADLMLDPAMTISLGERAGKVSLGARTTAQWRSNPSGNTLLERGFGGKAMVEGRIAMVWLPYDFYVNGAWSHCGIDVFTMVKQDTTWKIANLAYTMVQPPECAKHPAGPPKP
ncbi:MAG: hypothetical protein SFU84_16025 [Gemmatimonadales bacterium]|nr:hypothetical protein [Gemmatimonadales bacterium]